MSALLIFGRFIDLLLQLIVIILLSGIYAKVINNENMVKFVNDNKTYITIAAILYNIIKFVISLYI